MCSNTIQPIIAEQWVCYLYLLENFQLHQVYSIYWGEESRDIYEQQTSGTPVCEPWNLDTGGGYMARINASGVGSYYVTFI
jgi:hypothetical protein